MLVDREIRIVVPVSDTMDGEAEYNAILHMVENSEVGQLNVRIVADTEPRCDICDKLQDESSDWNGETGNHRSCEEGFD